jgi:hypothetical protein
VSNTAAEVIDDILGAVSVGPIPLVASRGTMWTSIAPTTRRGPTFTLRSGERFAITVEKIRA